MKKIYKHTIIIIIVIFIGVFAIFKIQINTNQTNIGIILPLSGNMAFIGEDMKRGIDLAFKDRTDFNIIYEDNQGDTAKAVSSYHTLQNTYSPDVIISGSAGDLALIPLAENDKTPLILTNSSASGLPSKGDYIFRYFTSADYDAPAIASYARDVMNLDTISVIYVKDQFGIDYKNIFSKTFEEKGGNITSIESFTYQDYDYRSLLIKIKEDNPDGIYLVGLDYQLSAMLQQIKDLGITSQVLSLGTIATKDAIEKTGNAIEGVYTNSFCTDGSPENYVTQFKETYSSYPGFFSELGYDIGKMIIKSAENNKEKEHIRENLLNTKDFQGNAGIISADKNGEMVIPLCIKKITDGKIFNTVTKKYSNY